MPLAGDSFTQGGPYSQQTVHRTAPLGEMWSWQNYPVAQSAKYGKGGWNHDVIARSRIKGADGQTRDILRKAQERENWTHRQLKHHHHKTTKAEPNPNSRAQSSYLLSWIQRGIDDLEAMDPQSLLVVAGGLAFLYMVFK